MSEAEEAASEELREIVGELDGICARLVNLHGQLPGSAEGPAMLADEMVMDASTEVRSVIECVLNDSLRPAIRDLAAAVSNLPRRPRKKEKASS